MWNPFSSPFSKSSAVTFTEVQSSIKGWISIDTDDFNEVWKKFTKYIEEIDKIQLENRTLKAQLDLTELECTDAVEGASKLNMQLQFLEEQVDKLTASRDAAMSENSKLEETITVMNFKEKGMINTLEAELSLRNEELDEAFGQISNLTNQLQDKEDETFAIIKELEMAKEELVAEKNALKIAMDENASMATNFGIQMQSIKSQSELEIHDHVMGLQTERDDAISKYSALMSEKGVEALSLAAEEKVRELEVQLSLRNVELDDAFSQISKLKDDVQFKEGQALEIIKELETSRDSLIAEKENLLAIVDENSVALKNMEAEIQNIKSESDQAVDNRILELQSERDNALSKCTFLMSEKEVINLAAEEKLRELNTLLSLRNGELDDAFAQITDLTNQLEFKEGQAHEVMNKLDVIVAEKNALQKDLEENIGLAKNLENQIQSSKSEFELANSSRIIELQKERDSALTQYSALLSEKDVLRLEADERIRELDTQLSLRNGELDDAFSQIANFEKELRAKEEDEALLVQAVEGRSVALTKEREKYQFLLDEKSLLISHLEGEIKNLEANVYTMETRCSKTLSDLDTVSKEKKMLENQLNENVNMAESSMAEYRRLSQSLAEERDIALIAKDNIQQVAEKLALSLETSRSSISLLNGVMLDKFSFINESVERLRSKFSNAEELLVQCSKKMKCDVLVYRQKESDLLLKIQDLEASLVEKPSDDNQSLIKNMESTIKSQTDTIKGFEMALIEAQKYMDEKECLAQERLNELSKLQALNSETTHGLQLKELELNKSKEEIDKLVSKVTQLEQNLYDKDSEMLSAVSKLQAHNEEILIRLDQEQQSVNVLNEQINQLNGLADDFASQDSKMAQLSAQLSEKEKEYQSVVGKMQADNQELQARINKEEQKVMVLNEELENLNGLANDYARQDAKMAELKTQLLNKDSEMILAVSKLQSENQKLQKRVDEELQSSKNIADVLQEKVSNLSELEEKLKSMENESLASKLELENLSKSHVADNVTESVEKISIETQTNHDNLANDHEELKCQLKLTQKELEMLYPRITEQEIQIRSLKLSEPRSKELEDQLEKLNAKYTMLEKTAEQTNSLNDDLNEKYLEAIKKTKNLENVVKKLYKLIEAKNIDQENNSITDCEKSYSNPGHDHKTSIPVANKASPSLKPSILKRSSGDVEKTAESISILKESRSANSKQKLGPASRVPAIESRKIRKIDTSREGRQECNQQ